MDTLDDIAKEQAATAADEEEEKKRKNKKKALIGLAALLVAGGCSSAVCVGSRYIAPQPEPEVAVVVEKREIAPTPTEYLVPISPTPTEAVQEPVDVREGWYGHYRGTASGNTTNQRPNERFGYSHSFEDEIFWLEITDEEGCYRHTPTFCDENLSWGAEISYTHNDLAEAVAQIWLYLPENLSDAPNLTITEDSIRVTATEEHPYELVIERTDGHVVGHLRTTGRPLEQWIEVTEAIPEIDYFEAHEATWDEFPFTVRRTTSTP